MRSRDNDLTLVAGGGMQTNEWPHVFTLATVALLICIIL
jgi:hypothetical protein